MFKSARWRSEKDKIKVVFKLQFHAAQLTHAGGDALTVSVIPVDTGKPTVKSDRATARDGSCFWENPVYETVKFIRDPKSGKIHEKIYYFVVGTGSSKAGVIGEAFLDFSNYAEATKVSLVSLPLKNLKTQAILNVSILRMQESIDQRWVEESANVKLQLAGVDGTINSNSAEVAPLNKTVSRITELNGNRRASSRSDVTIPSSEGSLGVEEASSTDDSSNTPREASLRLNSHEDSEMVIEKLQGDVTILCRQVEMSELELQTLRKQIVKESKKGQELFRENVCLKEEREILKEECEKLKTMQRCKFESKSSNNLHFQPVDFREIVEELRQELNHVKELNANLQLQLQKTQESNSELILAVTDLDEMLEEKNKEITNLLNGSMERKGDGLERNGDGKLWEEVSPSTLDDENDDEELKALEELEKEQRNAKQVYLLEQQIIDLRSEIEICKRDKDGLEMQMEQLSLEYEIMKQENHDMSCKLEQSQIQEQLKLQYECLPSFSTPGELESQIDNLENELKRRNEESLDSLTNISRLESDIESLQNELKRRSRESSSSLVSIRELESQIENLQNELKKQLKESLVERSELESQIKNLQNEMNRESKDTSNSLVKIGELEAHVLSLEEELKKQAQGFEADVEALTLAKVEQEQRAIRAEEKLRKTRWQNANTAERLQEEFKKLTVQMTSMLKSNEKLTAKALAEANELRLQKAQLEGLLQNASEEKQSIKDQYEARLIHLGNQVVSMSSQVELLQSEINEREHRHKQAEENGKRLADEISILIDEIETQNAKTKILLDDLQSKGTLTDELDRTRTSIKELQLLVEQENSERIKLERRFVFVNNEVDESQKELNKLRCCVEEKEMIIRNQQLELENVRFQYKELKANSRLENDLEKEKLRKLVVQLKSDLKKKEDSFRVEQKAKDANGRGTSRELVKAGLKANQPHRRGSKEVANLRERIKLLEIKLKETALETSANKFLEKEKDLHSKIEEQEGRLEVLNRNSAHYCESEAIKDPNTEEDRSSEICSANNSRNLDELVNEISSLKERNKTMEEELKEMQGRYSELSLKFAEVEGERQRLVMKLRNIKR